MDQESPSDYYQGTHYYSAPDPYLPEPVHTAAVHSSVVTSRSGSVSRPTSCIGSSNRPASCPMPAMHYPEDYPEEYSDMEKCKLERKRERNRLAANKCRMKKVERIVELDQEVTGLQEEQRRLGRQRDQLRHQVATLRARLQEHLAGGKCRHTSAPGRTRDSTC